MKNRIRLKASGLEHERFGEYTLNCGSKKYKKIGGGEFKNFLA